MARGAARLNIDKAGGTIFYTSNKSVMADNGFMVGSDGQVRPHGLISLSHTKVQNFETYSGSVFVCGLGAVRKDDKADCGHKSTGSKSVFVN